MDKYREVKMDSPCMNCKDRCVGCHGVCELYLKYADHCERERKHRQMRKYLTKIAYVKKTRKRA